MELSLIGLGGGNVDTMTVGAWKAIQEADRIIGSARLLEALPEEISAKKDREINAERIAELVSKNYRKESICVIYSGDLGFYSGAQLLIPRLAEKNIPYRAYPGISSVQLLSAAVGRSWRDWNLVSAHGMDCNAVAEVTKGRDTFFLTGGELTPRELCAQLKQAGLGFLQAAVGENLSYETEKIIRGTVETLADQHFAKLSVLLVEGAPHPADRTEGLPDTAFIRGRVPMTKQNIRAAIRSHMMVKPTDVIWDIGAGTGSVSVELSRAAYKGSVFAVEYKENALELIEENRKRLKAWNLYVAPGRASEVLDHLPAPDAVFIGGSSGEMDVIIDKVLSKNPQARICASAITVETLADVIRILTIHGIETSVTQIAVSKSRKVGDIHMMEAENPIWLLDRIPEH